MTNQVRIKRSSVPGKVPAVGDLNLGELALNTHDGRLFLKRDDGVESIIEIGTLDHSALQNLTSADQHTIAAITGLQAALAAKVNLAGDSMTGNLSLPKTKGQGLLIDNGYAWVDLVGSLTPKILGTTAAVLLPFRGRVKSWAHHASSKGSDTYHMPHDYAPGTNLLFHVHWGHNGTSLQGDLVIKCWVSYAKRVLGNAVPFGPEVETAIVVPNVTMTAYPRWVHSVNEIQLSTPGGAANMLDTNMLETDGMIIVDYEVDTIPSIDGSDVVNVPYIQTFDIHMQSTGVGTKNNAPDFWE